MHKLTMTLAVISALSASSAYAQDGNSRLQVTMDRPAGLMVDGRMQEVEEQSMTYLVENLQAGRHEVSVRAIFGRELANIFVDIPESSEVRCRWRRKNFECYDTIALAPVVAPIAEPALAIAQPAVAVVETAPATQVVETTTVTTTTDGLGMGEPMPNIGGSIAIAGPEGESVSIGVNLGGMGMGMGMNTQVTETTTVTTTHSAPVVVEAVETQAIPSRVSLIVRNTDGEWADFLVDGKVVAEFRNEEEIKVDISSGTHTIEVREFMEDKGYTRAKIDTGFASEIVVGLTEGQPIECFNHDGCYTK